MDSQSPPPSYEECMSSRPHTPQSYTYGSGGHQSIPIFQSSPNPSCHSSHAVSPTLRVYRHGEQVIPIMIPEPPNAQQALPLQAYHEANMAVGLWKCYLYTIFLIVLAVAFIFLKAWQDEKKRRRFNSSY